MARSALKTLTAALLTISLTVASTSSVLAASCDPGRAPNQKTHHAGSEETDYPGVTGIRADVWESDVYVDFGTNVASSAWVMLNGGPGQFAQVGWLEQAFNNRKVFIQYLDSNGNQPLFTFSPKHEDQFTQYTANYKDGEFRFWVSGVQYNPSPTAAFNPSKSQIMGEIKNENNQMPGISSAKQKFDNAQRRNSDFSTWSTFFGDNAGTTNPDYFTFQNLGLGNTKIWDDC